MEKKDLEDWLARQSALLIIPIFKVLLQIYKEQLDGKYDADKLAKEFSGDLKKGLINAIIDYENIRSGGIIDLNESMKGRDEIKTKLRKLGREILDE